MRTDTLHEFVHLSSTLNFTRTASAFGISQPALSNRIASLERELGFPLLDRTETISLTEEGRAFLKEVSPLLDRLDHAVEHCRLIHQRQSRTLVFETVPGNEIVLKVVSGFKKANPDVDIEIADLEGSSIVERIQQEKALCGLFLPTVDIKEAKRNNPDVAFIPMGAAEMLAWVENDGPFGQDETINPQDLSGCCLVYPANLYRPMNEEGVRWLAQHWGIDIRVEGRYGRTFDEFVFNGIQPGDILTLMSCFRTTSACNYCEDRTWKSFEPAVMVPLYLAYRADCADANLRRLVEYLEATNTPKN